MNAETNILSMTDLQHILMLKSAVALLVIFRMSEI